MTDIGQYILVDGMPTPEPDILKWGRWFEQAREARIVAKTDIGENVHVSTVFLALDHSFGGDRPLLWETMIFGGPHDQETWRYSSRAEAEAGHLDAVAVARGEREP